MQKVTFLIAASLGLAGCGTLPTNTSMYSVHQPVVERTNYAIDLASDGDGIAVADQTRLNEWFEVLDLRYGDRIAIDSGNGFGNEDAARDVRAAAAERGIMITQGAPATPGIIAPGNIRVVVTRSQASVPSCPDHRTQGQILMQVTTAITAAP
jgi:pilus assembly protein CpaD